MGPLRGAKDLREHEEAERIASAFHEAYERLAPDFGYRTRLESAKPWEDVPDSNKRLMRAAVRDLIARGVITEDSGTTLSVQVERLTAALEAATKRLEPVTVGPPAGEVATQAQRREDDRLELVDALFGVDASIHRASRRKFNVYKRGLYYGGVEVTPNGELVWVA